MRIISLVPSWTETLLEAGVSLVGRTRFCLHPREAVSTIPVVGGTKSADWEQIQSLKPDLLILDQEENPREFSEKGIPYWASHVTDGKSLERDLKDLGQKLSNSKILSFADRIRRINVHPVPSNPHLGSFAEDLLVSPNGNEKIVYVIWKKPWMAVSPDTYIGFVLRKLGLTVLQLSDAGKKYPEFEMQKSDELFYLFSSEPYPFRRNKDEILDLGVKAAIVDGEKFSWFGIRSIRFLEEILQISNESSSDE